MTLTNRGVTNVLRLLSVQYITFSARNRLHGVRRVVQSRLNYTIFPSGHPDAPSRRTPARAGPMFHPCKASNRSELKSLDLFPIVEDKIVVRKQDVSSLSPVADENATP